jgi:sec-independent protein translocase protein TatA
MPIRFGPTELMLILAIILVLFGVGRVGKIASELGQGIREFRKGLSVEEKSVEEPKQS